MAHSKLPLRIRVDVRDHFEAPTCPAQKAFASLEGLVGLKLSCNTEWDLLWNELESNFPDKTTFVPNVAGAIVVWCSVLSARLEDDRFAVWTEELVGKLGSAGAMELRVQVSDDQRPTTTWLAKSSSFVLALPRSTSFAPNRASSGLEADFENLFNTHADRSSSGILSSGHNDDEWAEIDGTGEAASIRPAQSPPNHRRPDELPVVATLASPDVLLRSLTPYVLHVTQQGSGKLLVHGTHEPSLQLLAEYLQRWTKRDHQDTRKIPLLRIALRESHFGLGLSHDTLTIEPYDTPQQRHGVEANPTLVLAVVEGVLGYRRLPGVSAGFWEFRREIAFM